MTTSDSDPKPSGKRASRKKSGPSIIVGQFSVEDGFRLERPESPEEVRSRLAIEESKAAHEIWRDRAILLCCLFAVPVLIIACFLVLLLPGGSVEARTWAASTLTGIASGIVGYSLGKSGKSS